MPLSDLLAQAWDIIVVGTGAAALTSALSALTSTSPSSDQPPKVLLIDRAPASWGPGGNGYFTAAAYRVAHGGLADLLPLVSNVPDAELAGRIDLPAYSEEDFLEDLKRVSEGRTDEKLCGYVVKESLGLVRWLRDVGGVDWWLSFRRQAYEVDGRWVFWGGLHLTVEGGGKGLIGSLVKAVEEKGGVISYQTEGKKILTDDAGRVRGLEVEIEGKRRELLAPSVILCAGGFEANPELRMQWMGPGWELAHTRGTPHNKGEMMLAAMELGANSVGDFSPTGCHSVAWDADSPKQGGDREKTNEFTKSGYPLGIMVNVNGERFVDEGVDMRNYTYAKFGREILKQPGGIVFQIWDNKGTKWLRAEEYRDEVVRKTTADSMEDLAEQLLQDGLKDKAALVRTISEYNDAVIEHRKENPEAALNPAIKDGLSTQSSRKKLRLPKSNWALAIQEKPFLAVKVTSGITFTFGGLAIDPEKANVLSEDGPVIEGLYCAGEMVGGLFYGNYPGGSGLTAGGIFGRRAGKAAAERVDRLRADAVP